MQIKCDCCQTEIDKVVIYSKNNCPIMYNVFYRTREEAVGCLVGNIELVRCPKCNFVFNCNYNKQLLTYDNTYNNRRLASSVYNTYLDKLVDICSLDIDEKSKILEIGCGKGEFLRRLCAKTNAKGFGYDCSYEEQESSKENIIFKKEYFEPKYSKEKYDIMIMRHTLEHIPEPYVFLKNIVDNGTLLPGSRIWIEVPDFEWTLRKKVFSDIAYEHCNYFFKETLCCLFNSAGIEVITLEKVFDEQYILFKGEYQPSKTKRKRQTASIPSFPNLTDIFNKRKKKYREVIENAENVCIWCASGKGVSFLAELPKETLKKIKYVVDIDPQKQGSFLPVSGKKIDSPAVLKDMERQLSILVMNAIYEKEIKKLLDKMMVDAQLYLF